MISNILWRKRGFRLITRLSRCGVPFPRTFSSPPRCSQYPSPLSNKGGKKKKTPQNFFERGKADEPGFLFVAVADSRVYLIGLFPCVSCERADGEKPTFLSWLSRCGANCTMGRYVCIGRKPVGGSHSKSSSRRSGRTGESRKRVKR